MTDIWPNGSLLSIGKLGLSYYMGSSTIWGKNLVYTVKRSIGQYTQPITLCTFVLSTIPISVWAVVREDYLASIFNSMAPNAIDVISSGGTCFAGYRAHLTGFLIHCWNKCILIGFSYLQQMSGNTALVLIYHMI